MGRGALSIIHIHYHYDYGMSSKMCVLDCIIKRCELEGRLSVITKRHQLSRLTCSLTITPSHGGLHEIKILWFYRAGKETLYLRSLKICRVQIADLTNGTKEPPQAIKLKS